MPTSQSQEPSQPTQSAGRSLYRRHRPRTFEDVVGQEAVVRTLRNAVERDKVHHAYLLVGSRGTGKTSMAKILAACLNCEQGRSARPCGECASCTAIAEARSLDVIEMDAASNNSVEDIRELRDSAAFAPLSGRTKVYILDEAHMLSTAAWNAFLKTLEEPPPNTVFVLATTEAQKVPATVVDRCHRFDFQRPTVEQVARVLDRTAKAEGIAVPPEAVAALSKAAGGSFRDALGMLEQLVTYSGQEIALEDVLAVLGVADTRLIEQALDAVAAGDARAALLAVDGCVSGGRDVGVFAGDLERRARELMVVQVLGGVPAELSLTEEADARLSEQAQGVGHKEVVRLLDLLGVAIQAVRAGADARTQLELALVKAATPEVDPSMRALLARIQRLEAHGGGGGGGGAAVARGEPSGEGGDGGQGEHEQANAGVQAAGVASAGEGHAHARARAVPPIFDTLTETSPGPGQSSDTAGPASGHAEAHTQAPPASGHAEAHSPTPTGPAHGDGNAPDSAEPSQGYPPSAGPEADPGESIESIAQVWGAVVDMVRSGNALLGAVMADAQPLALSGSELSVAFPKGSSFNKRKAESAENRTAVSEAIAAVTGAKLTLHYELSEEVESREEAPGGDEEAMVRRIMDELDAEELPGEGAEELPGEGAESTRGALDAQEGG